jgi:hypothetical protein
MAVQSKTVSFDEVPLVILEVKRNVMNHKQFPELHHPLIIHIKGSSTYTQRHS